MKSKIGLKRKDWTSFILTLIATLFGVVLAIWLTNLEAKSKEKEDTIKLLHAGITVVDSTAEYSKKLNESVQQEAIDSITIYQEYLDRLQRKNPLPTTELLESIISNELFIRNVSEHTYGQIFDAMINLKKLAKYKNIDVYIQTLQLTEIILHLEIQFINGEIDNQTLESEIKKRRQEVYSPKNTEQKINNVNYRPYKKSNSKLMISTIISLFLCFVFTVLGAFHFYWLFGGKWGLQSVIPTESNTTNIRPIPWFATLIVAIILTIFGLIYLIKSGLLSTEIPNWTPDYIYWIIPLLFMIRATGEFKYVGFFKKIRNTTFAKADTTLFSPLCLTIGILGILLQILE